MNTNTIKTIERKLTDLRKDNETFEGSVFNNRFLAYAQGIAFVLEQFGFRVEWEDGTAHVVRQDTTIEDALKRVNDMRNSETDAKQKAFEFGYLNGMEKVLELMGYTVGFNPLDGTFSIDR